MRAYTVHVALGYADMLWISAAIEALEKATTTSSSLELKQTLKRIGGS
jgi:hypothetical protein